MGSVSLTKTRCHASKTVYTCFLRLLYGGQNVFDEYNGEDEQEQLQMQTLSVAQDLDYGVSGGKKWTSKHIGLSCIRLHARKIWYGCFTMQDIVSVMIRLQVDTALAESTLKSLDEESGAVIPSNISSSKFLHFTADNIDILDEILDSKNAFHAT